MSVANGCSSRSEPPEVTTAEGTDTDMTRTRKSPEGQQAAHELALVRDRAQASAEAAERRLALALSSYRRADRNLIRDCAAHAEVAYACLACRHEYAGGVPPAARRLDQAGRLLDRARAAQIETRRVWVQAFCDWLVTAERPR